MATSEALRAAAAGFDLHAAALRSALDGPRRASGPGVWHGPAAGRLDDQLDLLRRDLADAARELRRSARRLRLRAETVEEQERIARAAC